MATQPDMSESVVVLAVGTTSFGWFVAETEIAGAGLTDRPGAFDDRAVALGRWGLARDALDLGCVDRAGRFGPCRRQGMVQRGRDEPFGDRGG